MKKILLFQLLLVLSLGWAYGQVDTKVNMFEDFFLLSKTKSFKLDSLVSVNSGNIAIDHLSLKPSVYSFLNAYNSVDMTIRGLSTKRNTYLLNELQLNSPFNGTVPHEVIGLAGIGSAYVDYNRTGNKSFSNTGSELNFVLPSTTRTFDLKAVLQGGNSNGFGLINTYGRLQELFWKVGLVFNSRPDYPISKKDSRDRYTMDNSISTGTAALFNIGFENENSKLSLLMLLYNNNRDLPYNNVSDIYAKIPKDNRLFTNLNYKTYILDNIFLSGNLFFGTEDKERFFYGDKEMQFVSTEKYGTQNVKSYSYGFDTDFIFFSDYIPPVYADVKYRKDIIDLQDQIDTEKQKNETERLQLTAKQSYWIKEDVNFTYSVGVFISNPMRIGTGRAREKSNNILYDVGLTIEMAENLDLNLAIGRSVRAPYINEYASYFSDSIEVLIDLEPEVKNYYELGLNYQIESIALEANFFSNSIKNYIYPLYESIYRNIYVNNGNFSYQGGEAEVIYSDKYLDLTFSYSMLIESNSVEEEFKEFFDIYIPKDMLKSSITIKPLSFIDLNYSFTYLMAMSGKENLPVHDAYLDVQIIRNMKGKFAVKNISDEQVFGVFDLPLLGREFSVGAYIYF